MKKNIIVMCILGISMLVNTVAIAAPKGKEQKKSEKSTTQEKKKKSPNVKADKQKKAQDAKKDKQDKKKNKQDKKKQLQQDLKEWEQKKKNMKPLQLKDLVEENHQLRTKNGELKLAVEALQQKIEEAPQRAEHDASNAQSEVDKQRLLEIQKQVQTSAACRDLSELPAGSYTINQETGEVLIGGVVDPRYGVHPTTGIPFIKGTIFKVQIGAKYDLDLKDILIDEVNHETLEQEVAEGLYKYTIGHFRNYWEADKLKKGLRSMGIQLAWIVPYKDGNRVLLKEVLPEVMDKKKRGQ